MPAKPSGVEKTYTVRQKRPNGDVYIIERKVVYDPETKKNTVLSSHVTGKIPMGSTEVVPTRPKRTAQAALREDVERDEVSRLHTGMMDILAYIGKVSGIDALLYKYADRGTAEKIISIARYMVAEDRPTLPGITLFQLSHPLPDADGITEDVYSRLFEDVGHDESLQQNFFQGRCRGLENTASLAYDSTAIGTCSDGQMDARWNGRDQTELREIKLLVLYVVQTRQPVAFTKLPGNISDVVTIRTALKQLAVLGLGHATIISDNGYYSQANIAEMFLAGFHFLMPVKTTLRWIRNAIDHVQKDLESMNSVCPADPRTRGATFVTIQDFERPRRYGSSSKGLKRGDMEKVRRRVYVHVFFNAERKTAEDVAFDEDLLAIRSLLLDGTPLDALNETMQSKAHKYLKINASRGRLEIDYNRPACQEACQYHGYAVFISNQKLGTFEALAIYRQRMTIELFFEVFKQQVDGTRPRVWTAGRLRGRMFVQFVALCYYEYLAQKIRDIKAKLKAMDHDETINAQQRALGKKLLRWLEHNSVHLILQWFDPVETITISNALGRKRWTTEITKRDNLFLEELGMKHSF